MDRPQPQGVAGRCLGCPPRASFGGFWLQPGWARRMRANLHSPHDFLGQFKARTTEMQVNLPVCCRQFASIAQDIRIGSDSS